MENSDTSALVVTRDYPDSHEISPNTDIPDSIRVPLSVVNTGGTSSVSELRFLCYALRRVAGDLVVGLKISLLQVKNKVGGVITLSV